MKKPLELPEFANEDEERQFWADIDRFPATYLRPTAHQHHDPTSLFPTDFRSPITNL